MYSVLRGLPVLSTLLPTLGALSYYCHFASFLATGIYHALQEPSRGAADDIFLPSRLVFGLPDWVLHFISKHHHVGLQHLSLLSK